MDDTLSRAPSPTLFTTSNRGSPSSGRPRSPSPTTIGTAPATPQQQPVTNANATTRRGRRGRRKVLGLKTAHANQRGNDPFDYEQKYGEDEEFKEMGPMARIWKVFLDESGAFDSEMVEDWRDALDVLLVFAGLFSAVVTTFVSQLCQRLEADFTEINAHLMFESINIDRAKAAGMSVFDVPRSPLTPFTPFRPSRTAVWVNGLWFTSLALSLTTALMAVLMKQWIHQYMSVPSGTPRDRSRIRQFRYMSLQQWQVPVIIGLLPVLMHISLGVFFAGLIVFLYSLNTTMSGVITTIASLAFIIYFATNLLPLYNPSCPYKTPLTIHSYTFLVSVWDCVRKLAIASEPLPSKELLSLKAVEQETVAREADAIDAQSVTWLHDVSSNSSVQRVVLQALSNLPLGAVETVRKAIPDVHISIHRCLEEYGTAERRYGYERLTRAWIRFDKNSTFTPNPFQDYPVENSLLRLISASASECGEAGNFLAQQILKPTVELDPISWLWIFRNAVLNDVEWLEVAVDDSVVWASFLRMFLDLHDQCDEPSHCQKEVASIKLDCLGIPVPPVQSYRGFKLGVCESYGCQSDRKSTNDGVDFNRAIADFMHPSLCDFLLSTITFPPFVDITDKTLPSDIRLHLAFLQTPFIQRAHIPIIDGQPPLRRLIALVNAFVNIDYDVLEGSIRPLIVYHPQLPSAVFDAIHAIMTKGNAFDGLICHRDQRDLVHALFRCLVLDRNLREKHKNWLSDVSLPKKIVGVVFFRPHIFSLPLITEILDYFCLTKSIIGIEMYRGLLYGNWFDYLRHEFMLTDDDDEHALPFNEHGGAADYAHSFIAVGFIDGLESLEELSPVLYEQTLEGIRAPSNTLILSQVLILADVDSRNRLWKLARLVGSDQWEGCMTSLKEFVKTGAAKAFYQDQSSFAGGKRPYHEYVRLTFSSFDELGGIVDKFSMASQWGRDKFPLTTPIYNAPKQLEDLFPSRP